MDDIREAFRGVMLRDLRPIEDKDGVRIGEDVRIYKEKEGYVLRFLKGTDEKRRKQIRDRLQVHQIAFQEGKDFVL
ncbi:MAG: hypothetical protein KatS3mg102_1224 [Planctomycetota bacterium]|nr:MAG: hypothetical protein KatS3mg102_1224 [Planctomycetota bacterium]